MTENGLLGKPMAEMRAPKELMRSIFPVHVEWFLRRQIQF